MKFFIIPPINHLKLIEEGTGGVFGLAHLYVKHLHYRKYLKQRQEAGDFIIMDNSAAEKELVTEKVLLQVAVDLVPNEIIAPDVLFDGVSTIRNLESFVQNLKETFSLSVDKCPAVFGVPQGRTKEEWLFVYEYMLTHPDVSTIGLSKIAVPKAFLNVENDQSIGEARNLCYDILKAKNLIAKPLHLLGMGSPEEMKYYKNDSRVRSTDSCNTVWSAMNGLRWWAREYERIPTPKDYFDRSMTQAQLLLAKDNIANMRKIVNS